MSGEGGFLQRWSRLKREAVEPAEKVEGQAEIGAGPAREQAAEQSMPILPSLEDITSSTDISAFLHPAVPEPLRQAALRRMWSIDPAVRDFVSPAVDYAWDWNTPGGVPGNGPLGVGDDVARMLVEVMDGFARPEIPDGPVEGGRDAAPHKGASQLVASQGGSVGAPGTQAALADGGSDPDSDLEAKSLTENAFSAELLSMPDAPEGPRPLSIPIADGDTKPVAARRHGGAVPT